MNNDLFLDARLLARNGVRQLPRARGRRIECVSGLLWLTQDGDLRDIVLAPGEGFTADGDGDLLVSALADSRYLVLEDRDKSSPTAAVP